MRINAPLLSTAIRFMTIQDAGKSFAPDLVAWMKDRYRFWEVPEDRDEFDLNGSGAQFTFGRFRNQTIENIILYWNGISSQAICNTEVIDEFIDDYIGAVKKEFGLIYQPSTPVARGYLSSLDVFLECNFQSRLSFLNTLTETLNKMLEGYGVTAQPFVANGIYIQTDTLSAEPIKPGRFVIEPRADTPLGERNFFSQAPVSTNQHKELLKILEGLF